MTLALCALTPEPAAVAGSAGLRRRRHGGLLGARLPLRPAAHRRRLLAFAGRPAAPSRRPTRCTPSPPATRRRRKWKVAGKSPVAYLQSLDLEAVALATSPRNPPVYYAQVHPRLPGRRPARPHLLRRQQAGSTSSPSSTPTATPPSATTRRRPGGGGLYEISTTAWAILGPERGQRDRRRQDHRRRCSGCARSTPPVATRSSRVRPEKVDATAVAVLALQGRRRRLVQRRQCGPHRQRRRVRQGLSEDERRLHRPLPEATPCRHRRRRAGRSRRSAPPGSAPATSPPAKPAQTPLAFLRDAQLASGAFGRTLAEQSAPTLATTSLGTIGLHRAQYLPVKGDGSPATPNFRPYFVKNSVKPANGAVFYTRTVTVAATYAEPQAAAPGSGRRRSG